MTTKTIVPLRKFAQENGYEDLAQLERDADAAGVLFKEAGAEHIWAEGWDAYLQKSASKKLAKNKPSDRSLADTDQLGIIRSNLIRLPLAIQKKERRIRQIGLLQESASTDDEKLTLKSEARNLKNDILRHKENLKMAEASLARLQAGRQQELARLESMDRESLTEPDAKPSADETSSKKSSRK